MLARSFDGLGATPHQRVQVQSGGTHDRENIVKCLALFVDWFRNNVNFDARVQIPYTLRGRFSALVRKVKSEVSLSRP